jgi:hypothetical protein
MPTDPFSIAQLVGYAAYVLTVWAFWQKNDKKMLWWNAGAALAWALHYGLLFAWAGVVTELLVAARSAQSARLVTVREKHYSAIVFLAAFLLGGIFTYQHAYDFFTVGACMLATIAMMYFYGTRMRMIMLGTLSLWLCYNFFAGSIGGVLSSLTLILIQILTLLRMMRDQKGRVRPA